MSPKTSYKKPKSAAVIGLGYVGLPTAALLASGGIQTLGVDINVKLLDELELGTFTPREPGLHELLAESRIAGNLQFSNELTSLDAYIIAVPTPIHENKTPGMEFVLSACNAISKVIQPGQLVILESTSPPGSTSMVSEEIKKLRPDLDVSGEGLESVKFAYCPERVLPGNALHEIVNNERLVGGLTQESAEMAQDLYTHFTKGKIVICTDREAEMAKLVENSFRDVNIAFANEVARIATTLGVRAKKVIELANRHPRVNILSPGVGVGGHCISVDPWFLVDAAPDATTLIRSARNVNDYQPSMLANQVATYANEIGVKRVFCMGLSYKPNSDDLRESPAIEFVKTLGNALAGKEIYAFDPMLTNHGAMEFLKNTGVKEYSETIFTDSDLVVVLVDHDEFRLRDFGSAKVIVIHGRGQVLNDSI
jgi:UDP-N-acetyl-D-mannosaminuronic acid dehydrogenase